MADKTLRNLVEPVPENLTQGKTGRDLAEAERDFRAFTRLRQQELAIAQGLDSSVRHGKTMPSASYTRGRRMNSSETQLKTTKIIIPRVLLKPSSATSSSPTKANEPNIENTHAPLQPKEAFVNTSVGSRVEQSLRNSGGVKPKSPSERIAGLYTPSANVRTTGRNEKMGVHRATHAMRNSASPEPPTSTMITEPEAGVHGSDPALSHFLTLEEFDNQDYEVIPPQQRISLEKDSGGAHARSRYYVDSQTEEVWSQCRVVDYNENEGTFLIIWNHNGKQKWVKRLNLIFDGEDVEAWQDRNSEASSRRNEAEALLRLHLYIQSLPDSIVTPIDEDQVDRILSLVAADFPLAHIDVIERGVAEMRECYNMGFKRAVYDYQIHDPEMQRALKPMNFLAAAAPEVYSLDTLLGTIDTVSPNFRPSRLYMAKNLFVAHSMLYPTIQSIIARWQGFQNSLLCDTNMANIPRPCELTVFEECQNKTGDRVSERLREDWSVNIAATILSDLDESFNFYEDDMEKYKVSRMCRFFFMINLIMNTQLRSLLTSTIHSYKEFLQRYSVQFPEGFDAEEDLLDDIQEDVEEVAYMKAKLAVGEARRKKGAAAIAAVAQKKKAEAAAAEAALDTANKKPKRGGAAAQMQPEDDDETKKAAVPAAPSEVQLRLYRELPIQPPQRPYSKRLRHMTQNVNGLIPLFNIRLISNGDAVIFDPLLEEVEDKVKGIFDNFFCYTDNIKGVGEALFPLLTLETTILKPLSHNEDFVRAAKGDIHRVLQENLQGPRQLQQLYQRFEYILKIDIDSFIEEFAAQQPPPTRQDFDDVLDRLMRDLDRIERRSLTQVKFELIRVQCDDIKAALCQKGTEIAKALMDLCAKMLKDETTDCGRLYEDINANIRVEPKNPEELQKLKQYIDNVPQELLKLVDRFRLITEGYELLANYKYFVVDEDFNYYWRVFEWPRKVGQVLEDSEFKYREYRGAFQVELHDNIQTLSDHLTQLNMQIELFNRFNEESNAEQYHEKVRDVDGKLKNYTELANLYNRREVLFLMPQTSWSHIKEMRATFEPFQELWEIVFNFNVQSQNWENNDLDKVEADEVETKVTEWSRKVNSLVKKIKEEGPHQVAVICKEKLDKFKPNLPLLKALRNPGLKPSHWKQIAKLEEKNCNFDSGAGLTLNSILAKGLGRHVRDIEMISENASKMYALSNQLEKMNEEWRKVQLTLEPYGGDTYVLKANEDIDQLLSDHIMKTQTMMSSPFLRTSAPLEESVKQWEKKLTLIQNTLDEWFKCQRTWVYLEPIFQGGDIGKALPTEAMKFSQVNTSWRDIMRSTSSNRNVQSKCSEDKLWSTLHENNVNLEDVLKKLNQFLEQKRQLFPRFYFISNEELLQILSKSNDPLRIQDYLSKCFEGINKLHFEDNLDITAMYSGEQERVQLVKKLNPADHGNAVEVWLSYVEGNMWDTIKDHARRATKDYRENAKRTDFIRKWPGQIVIAICSVFWTQETEEYMKSGGYRGLAKYEDKCKAQLDDLVILVRDPTLSSLERCTLQALVVIEVHARDMITDLVKKKVDEVNAFDWQAQLRYVWEDKELKVRQTNACLVYGYEYLGNTGRLVITPLTDRCYRTLMGALHLNYGGAPEGPAGTGKTETTKDLAKAVAKQCVVYNCSDQISYKDMSKLFKGLSQAGAWGCFDEFNRIEIQVLSVIAMQVQQVQEAVQMRRIEFAFDDIIAKLRIGVSIFITMNPGYAGRAELPDNLKALFRPVAMMVPNYAMIGEISLFSYGFLKGRSLANKIVATYKLCSEQLSTQDHYDYGMRAVKSVLTAAGRMKQLYPNEDESILMLRSIQDVNLPKFLNQDAALFQGISSDLFPGVVLPAPDYDNMRRCMLEVCEARQLQPTQYFLLKAFQTYEMIVVRHGMMLVGFSLSGKSCALQMLAESLTKMAAEKLEEKTRMIFLNPKSITMSQLYGKNDVSGDWSDGVLSNAFRTFSTDNSPDRKWLVIDGPVDALWIENMNTVLDDNKKLCLTNGDIIPMSFNMNMIFETENLAVASPATVSRCGMVYLEPESLGFQPLVDSWLAQLPTILKVEHLYHTIVGMFDIFLTPCLEFVRKNCGPTVIPQGHSTAVSSFLKMFSTYVDTLDEKQFAEASERDSQIRLEGWFLMSLIWTVGGSLWTKDRIQFNAFTGETFVSASKGDKYKPQISLPDKKSLYDCKFVSKDLKFVDWLESGPFQVPEGMEYHNIIVPTTDTARYSSLVMNCIENGLACLLVGHTGTGKTILVKQLMMTMNNKEGAPPAEAAAQKYLRLFIQFSAQTSANQTQDLIDSSLKTRRKGVLAPPIGKKMVIFVDDLNMPLLEEFGAQPPIELLRQWFDFHGWYNHSKESVAFKQIIDVQFLGAMGPPEGGRNPVTARFTRHFNTISVPSFDEVTMKTIFMTLADWIVTRPGYSSAMRLVSQQLVVATLEIYQVLVEKLKPTPEKSHYTFNLRDVSKVFQGVSMASAYRITEPIHMYRLWVHESFRVFADRFTTQEDTDWFKNIVNETVTTHFKMPYRTIVTQEPLVFADYMDLTSGRRTYVEVDDIDGAKSVLENQLDEFNAQSRSGGMNLVVFNYVIEHVSRICRILRQPYGHALLVGVGGSGRQSCTKLASFVCEYDVFQIQLTKGYKLLEFRDDMKKLLMRCSNPTRDMRSICFLMTDTLITEEAFLEDICTLLNTGEIPNLFVADEIDQIVSRLEKMARELGREASRDAVFAYFVERCRIFVHVVLAFSPVGKTFRQRLLKFPSLVNCTTIDWFREWPAEGLRAVAKMFLDAPDADDQESGLDQAMKQAIMEIFSHFHSSVGAMCVSYLAEARQTVYVTPTSYLELITTFKAVLVKKKKELLGGKTRYDNGLEQLRKAQEEVDIMKQDLAVMRPELKIKLKETDELIVVIAKESEEVAKIKQRVAGEEKAANIVAEKAKKIRDECEEVLAEAEPELRSAQEAVKKIEKKELGELRGMGRPPDKVKYVMEGVCLMLKKAPVRKVEQGRPPTYDYWETSKALLFDVPTFLDSMINYPIEELTDAIVEKVNHHTRTLYPDVFDKVQIANVSKACVGLVAWVLATEKYYQINKIVKPKKADLAVADLEFETANKELQLKMRELAIVNEQLATKVALLDREKETAKRLEEKVIDTDNKIRRAGILIDGLKGEKTRYETESVRLAEEYNRVLGDVVVGAGVIGYLGPFQQVFRQRLVTQWVQFCAANNIPGTQSFLLSKFLGEPVKIQAWKGQGLPSESFSVDNAVIMANARRWPLLVDPQQQASNWIKRMEREAKLVVVKPSDNDYTRIIAKAVREGHPVLLENVEEELDPVLEPLILKQIKKEGSSRTVLIGDPVEYNEKFRLYITTKLPRPHYKPEVSTKVQIINFLITPSGLEEQLLAKVVWSEKKEIEIKKQECIRESTNNAKELKDIEDRVLAILGQEGNLLENEEAITELGKAQTVSEKVALKQKEIEHNERIADKVRSQFVPVAKLGSALYFCVAELSNIDPMYQYSLQFYMDLFWKSLQESERVEGTDAAAVKQRIENISTHFQFSLYKNICRSLFAKDQLLFSFVMSIKVINEDAADVRWLCTGGLESEVKARNPCSEWLPDINWRSVVRASAQVPSMKEFEKTFSNPPLAAFWKTLFESETPHLETFPKALDSLFPIGLQRLMVMRCLRLDKLINVVVSYVKLRIGKEYTEPPLFSLEGVYEELTQSPSQWVPIILVLSPGANPAAEFDSVADLRGMSQRNKKLSLGQGQDKPAMQFIEEGKKVGNWVMLQNCHLYNDFMPILGRIVDDYSRDDVRDQIHKDFRLWLTSMPSESFPISILQNGVKLIQEAPKGLRSNLLRSYISEPISDLKFFNGCHNKPSEFRKLLFGLCFFHSLVQERRAFGPLGWNRPYEFNDTDMRISARQLQMFLNEQKEIPYEALLYLTGHCNYGGRVTDDWDRRCLMAILSKFYTTVILKDDYKFSPSGVYYAPAGDTQNPPPELYVEYIKALPQEQRPEIFGFHNNADITKDERESRQLLESTLQTQPRDGGSGKEGGAASPKDVVFAMATDLAQRIPKVFHVESVQERYPMTYNKSMNTVLIQELLRYNKLVATVHKSLSELQKALKGEVAMSPSLEQVYNAFYDNKIPTPWRKPSFPSLKPLGAYINDLVARLQFFHNWIQNGEPAVFWLSGFFFTQSFLTGVMQNYARANKVEIDTLVWDYTVMQQSTFDAQPKDGCYVNGLFLEAAGWDAEKQVLCESKPKVLFIEFPIVYLRPCLQKDVDEVMAKSHRYDCPVYKTLERRGVLATTGHSSNFVMVYSLPRAAETPEDHWVIRGAALFTQLDY